MTTYRARVYRAVFLAAAVYNVAFGAWAGFFPGSFFAIFDLTPPLYPSIWACVGMVVGVYGLGYAYAAQRLDRATPFIAIGLLGKVLGPAGWVLTVVRGEWPVRTLSLVVLNDVIWWVPFALFLIDGTLIGARVRRTAPYACAAINVAALAAMALVLRAGTEIVESVDARVTYIASHLVLWRLGWVLWIGAAISLLLFYAWWGAFSRRSTLAIVAVAIAGAGLMCDVLAESLLIGWLPARYAQAAPIATLLTGAAANGLYTIAGALLTIATTVQIGALRDVAWAIWIAGAALTICALAGSAIGMAISTTVLFLMFAPWTIALGRRLASDRAVAS